MVSAPVPKWTGITQHEPQLNLRRTMPFKRIVAHVLVGTSMGISSTMYAQTAEMVIPTRTEPSKSLDTLVSDLEKKLVPLAEAMPADKYNFVPSGEQFKIGRDVNYKGVRTFGQQLAHIIQANDSFFFGVKGVAKPDAETTAKLAASDKLTQKEDLLKALRESFASAHAAVATLTPENAWDHAGRRATDTRAEEVAHAVGHANDIYGQLVEYLRMNGIVPPASEGRPLANPSKTN
jgi:uncharacterized damage-inducible protein DinB